MEKADRLKAAINLAKKFQERCKGAYPIIKGKKADVAALEFFCGAAVWAELSGDPDTAQYLAFHCQMIAVRGMSWVDELAAKEVKEAA